MNYMETKAEILEAWIEYKRPNMKTQTRLDDYKRMIKRFIEHSNKPLKDYQEPELVSFLNAETKRYNTRTMNELKVLLRNFITWYFPDYPQRFRNMTSLLRHLRVEPTYSSSDMLSKEEVEKIIKAEDVTFWKTFWLVLFYAGNRPSECAKLKWKDITFSGEGAFIDVYVLKNQKKFTKFIPENVAFYLKKLKEQSRSELVFPSRIKKNGTDMPMQRNGINKRLKILSLKVLGKKINPYRLRHSIASILYNEDGTDKDFVAEQMGHSRNMEKVYSHLSSDKIRTKLKKLYIKTEDTPEVRKKLEDEILKLKAELEKVNQRDSNITETLKSMFSEIQILKSNAKEIKPLIVDK